METGIIGTKQRHSRWATGVHVQTLLYTSGNPWGRALVRKLGYPSDDKSWSSPGFAGSLQDCGVGLRLWRGGVECHLVG